MKPKPITVEDYTRLSPYFVRQKYPLCAYTLASIIVWRNRVFEPRALERNGSLVVGAHYFKRPGKNYLILPISPDREYRPSELHELALKLGVDNFAFVPESYLKAYGRREAESYFHIKRQPYLDDYVYKTSDLATLPGNRYAKKRNLISQFKRRYLDDHRVAVSPMTPNNKNEALDFLFEWCEENECEKYREDNPETQTGDDLSCERDACMHAIEDRKALHLDGLVIRIDGNIAAFGIGTRLTGQMGVLHFEKAFSRFKGLYQFLDRECARRLFSRYSFINKESDMDVPGLKKAKKSYLPDHMVRAFEFKAK